MKNLNVNIYYSKKVSVIIPAYNIEKYIGRCINSVINQSYSNIEIIVVIDGATDNTKKITKEFQKKDERIIVIEKKNGGLSSARNEGIEKASGNYTMFVDGDDYLSSNCIENLVLAAQKTNCDIVMFPYMKVYKNKKPRYLFETYKDFSEEQITDILVRKLIGPNDSEVGKLSDLDILNTAWGKLYKTEIVKKIRFVDTQKIGPEDGWYNILAFSKCHRIIYIDNCFYYYEKNNETSLLHRYDKNYYEKRKYLYSLISTFINDNNLSYNENLNNRIVMEFFSILKKICNSTLTRNKKITLVENILDDEMYKNAISQFNFSDLDIIGKIFWSCCKKKHAKILVDFMDVLLVIWRRK